MLCFAVFPPCIYRKLSSNTLITILSVLFGVISLYFLLIVFLPKEYYHSILYINPIVRLFDFIIGIYAAMFFLRYMQSKGGSMEKLTIPLLIAVLCLAVAVFISIIDGESSLILRRMYWLFICPFVLIVSICSATTLLHARCTWLRVGLGGYFSPFR